MSGVFDNLSQELTKALSPELTDDTRKQIEAELLVYFTGLPKGPIPDLAQRQTEFSKRIHVLAEVLMISLTDTGYVIDPGVELQTYTQLTRGSMWFDGNRDEVDALIISTALSASL